VDPLAAYAAIVSTVVLLIRLAEFRRDRDDLALKISTGVVVGPIAGLLGTDHIVQVSRRTLRAPTHWRRLGEAQ
jgi:L-cystine uptake protein TcyP (sodium:dicarboxylate symporter family)